MDLKEFIVRCSRDKVKEKSVGYHEKCSEAIISYLVASEAYGLPYHMYRIPRPGGRFNSVFLGA